MPETLSRKSPVYGKPCQQNQGQVIGRKPAHMLLWESVVRRTCHGKCEISDDRARSSFIDRDKSHSDRAFQLIRPSMPLEIVIERIIATVERRDLVLFFETADEDGQSVSHCPDERLCWIGRFARRKLGKALQFLRGPGDLDTRKREFRRNAFEARKNQFLPFALFAFAEYAMTALSFSDRPAKQRHGVGKKIRIAAQLQLFLRPADHAVLGGGQICLKL